MTLNGILPLPKEAFCHRDSQIGPQFRFLPVSPSGISAGVVLGRFDYWFRDVFGVDVLVERIILMVDPTMRILVNDCCCLGLFQEVVDVFKKFCGCISVGGSRSHH